MAITVKGGLLAAIPIAVLTAAFYWVKSRKIHEDIKDVNVDLIPELPKVALEQLEGREKLEVIQRKRLFTLEEKFVLDNEGVVKERFVGDAETCRNFIDDPVSLKVNKNKGDVLAENNNLIAESIDSKISDVESMDSKISDVITPSQDSLCGSSPSTQASSSTQSNPSTKSRPDTTLSVTKSEHSCNESFEGPVNGDASAEADDTDAMVGDDCASDSGQGSDQGEVWTEENQLLVYQFHIPTKLCGRFIGTAGSFINKLKKNCTCNVTIGDIKDNVAIVDIKDKKSSKKTQTAPRNGEGQLKLCSVEGTRSNIDKCLNIIRDKFARNSELTLEQTNKTERVDTSLDDGSITLNLAQGILHHVFVSSIVSGGHVFLQQPEHPTFAALERLDQCMLNFYTDYSTPQVPRPIQPTSVAVAPSNGAWYRCLVVSYNSVSDSCDIKYVDYGGYETIQADQLRQIRIDFLSLPFQAIEVYLANIIPSHVENVAAAILEEIVSGQVVEAREIGHAEDGTALVHLYRREGGVTAMVNRELVDRGVASWQEDVSPNH